MMINVRDINDFVFCPLRFYYAYVLNLGVKKLYWDELGKRAEEHSKLVLTTRLGKYYEVTDIKEPLISEALQVKGIPDLVFKHKKYSYYMPCEIKNSKKLKREFLYSLAAYGLLLEDCEYFPVKELCIYLVKTDKVLKIEFTDYLRETTISIIRTMHDIVSGKTKPYPRLDRCSMCDFRDYCDLWKHEAGR